MKISKIEYENFRNFRDHGEIRCSTDGKVTIIYGKNGDGKTTLHQLCQWVFYGQVHFNRTTTDHLYNLDLESEKEYGDTFDVMGRIDFEHGNKDYSLTRTYTYRRELDDSSKVGEDLSLLCKDDDENWKPIDRPQDVIDTLLPPGLSDYFFFDGESMIADLKVKGSDSAKNLRTALYSIFDLDILENAIDHVGDTQYKTSALGKLYLSQGGIGSGSDISACKRNIEGAQGKIESIKGALEKQEEDRDEKEDQKNKISEQIGATKSKAQYEATRKEYVKHRDRALNNVSEYQRNFGDEVSDEFPQMLISKAVAGAKNKIHLKAEETTLPYGLNKRLISYLVMASTKTCICGNPLHEAEKDHIKQYLKDMPPIKYTQVYQEFSLKAQMWGKGYSRQKLEEYIKKTLDALDEAKGCDKNIRKLDDEQKNSPDIENLVVDRQNAENRIKVLDESITSGKMEQKKYELYLKREMEKFDKLTAAEKTGKVIKEKIEILMRVKEYLQSKKKEESEKYSKKLEVNIQKLVDKMLTSKRTVEVSPEFAIRVYDSHGDESKSEGQFAVVSFAYIGGIFKLIQEENTLKDKEYPLVLDGPFSKLDPDQRQNVIEAIPTFAPQVILFSKDSLQEYFPKDSIGRVWTIKSNDEKNIANVEEGYLW